MDLNSRVQQLRQKHEALSSEVETAQRQIGSDDLHISEMKKEKLRLKEEIARLSA